MRARPNVCMVGYGMMGGWHSEGLKRAQCTLHTAVGPNPEKLAAFAAKYRYQKNAADLAAALADPEIDIVILASPTEFHAAQAIQSIEAGRATLVEIPIALSLADAERVVDLAERRSVPLGVVHPMRFRPERAPAIERIGKKQERVTHAHGRLFIHRLVNIGASGYKRSWTDNILWHHAAHLVDLGLWMLTGGMMADADERVRHVHSNYPPPDPRTGIPMEIVIVAETYEHQTVAVTGSYYATTRIYDTLVVTDRDSYRLDELAATLTTGEGVARVASEQANAELVAPEFVDAVRAGRDPFVPGWSVLPTMRILQKVQDDWDERNGAQSIPGRPLS